MKFCANCQWDLTGVELENENTCPRCDSTLGSIATPKLIEMMKEVSDALNEATQPSIRSNVRRLAELSKIVEKGERKFAKEFDKRLEQMKELEFELHTIEQFCKRIGYKV